MERINYRLQWVWSRFNIFRCLFLCSSLYSCAALYGIKKRPYNEAAINQFVATVDYDHSTVMNDSLFSLYYYSVDSCADSSLMKNLFQPLQVHYFNEQLEHVGAHINCYAAPGLTLLNWQVQKKMQTFPPVSDIAVGTYAVGLQRLLGTYMTETQRPRHAIVFWNLYMKKQSRHLIHTVNDYIKDRNCTLILVNNDVWFEE